MRKHVSVCDSTVRVTKKRSYKKGSKAWVQAGPHVTRHNVSRGQRYHKADRGGVRDRHEIRSGQPGLGEPQESSSPIPPFIDKERSEMCGIVISHTTDGDQSCIQVSCLSNHTVCPALFHSCPTQEPILPAAGDSYQKAGGDNFAMGIRPWLVTAPA